MLPALHPVARLLAEADPATQRFAAGGVVARRARIPKALSAAPSRVLSVPGGILFPPRSQSRQPFAKLIPQGQTRVPLDESEANLNRPTWQQSKKRPATRSSPKPAKTLRNRANFSICSWMSARSLCKTRPNGGEGGIRTLGTVAGTPDFESGTFNPAPPPLRGRPA